MAHETRSASLPPLGPGRIAFIADVGGTDIKSALLDAEGVLLDIRRSPTPRSTTAPAGAVIDRLGELLDEHLRTRTGLRPAVAGISVPGLVDEVAGTAVFSGNLGWRDVPFRAEAERGLGLPVVFGHDVRAAGRAEVRLGAVRDGGDAIVLVIGTGIAGAIVFDGVPYAGGGSAGEFGHVLAEPGGERCACGAIGCLETVASAGAIARRYTARSGVAVRGAREVLLAAEHGDPAARWAWESALDALAALLAHVTTTLAPATVVIGGGLAEADDALFVPLERRLDALLTFQRRPRLRKAALGETAGLIGTALAVRDRELVR